MVDKKLPSHEWIWSSWGISLHIPYLGFRFRWTISFKIQQFYSHVTISVVGTWKDTQPGWRVYNKRRKSHPSRNLQTIPTELPRFLYFTLFYIIELLVFAIKLPVIWSETPQLMLGESAGEWQVIWWPMASVSAQNSSEATWQQFWNAKHIQFSIYCCSNVVKTVGLLEGRGILNSRRHTSYLRLTTSSVLLHLLFLSRWSFSAH
jgi:hypothetical protein